MIIPTLLVSGEGEVKRLLIEVFLLGLENTLMTVPTNKEVFFVWFMTMRGKQISARDIEMEKENWG